MKSTILSLIFCSFIFQAHAADPAAPTASGVPSEKTMPGGDLIDHPQPKPIQLQDKTKADKKKKPAEKKKSSPPPQAAPKEDTE